MKRLLLALFLLFPVMVVAGQAPTTVTSPQISTDGVARTATLSWTAPTTYTDGTPINEVISYNLYEGLCSLGILPKVLGPITVLSVTRSDQPAGSVCWEITAQTPNGGESARTNRGSKTFPFPKPNTAPTLTVQ